VLQFVSACALGCSSFYFAKGWHFVCRFTIRLLSVVSSFRVAGNGLQIGDVASLEDTELANYTKVFY